MIHQQLWQRIRRIRKSNGNSKDNQRDNFGALLSSNSWQIIPVTFQKRHRKMLQWAYTLMSKRFIKIHPSLQELVVALRIAVVSDDWKLDKQQTSHHDTLDSLRLSLCNYEFPKNI